MPVSASVTWPRSVRSTRVNSAGWPGGRRRRVDVDDVVPLLGEVRDDRTPELAAATRDHHSTHTSDASSSSASQRIRAGRDEDRARDAGGVQLGDPPARTLRGSDDGQLVDPVGRHPRPGTPSRLLDARRNARNSSAKGSGAMCGSQSGSPIQLERRPDAGAGRRLRRRRPRRRSTRRPGRSAAERARAPPPGTPASPARPARHRRRSDPRARRDLGPRTPASTGGTIDGGE